MSMEDFIREYTVRGEGVEIKASEAKELYDTWAQKKGEEKLSVVEFSRAFEKYTVGKVRKSDGNYYQGIAEQDGRFDFV